MIIENDKVVRNLLFFFFFRISVPFALSGLFLTLFLCLPEASNISFEELLVTNIFNFTDRTLLLAYNTICIVAAINLFLYLWSVIGIVYETICLKHDSLRIRTKIN